MGNGAGGAVLRQQQARLAAVTGHSPSGTLSAPEAGRVRTWPGTGGVA